MSDELDAVKKVESTVPVPFGEIPPFVEVTEEDIIPPDMVDASDELKRQVMADFYRMSAAGLGILQAPSPQAAIKVVRMHSDVVLPKYQTAGSAGLDLGPYLKEKYVIPARSRARLGTGLKIQIPEGFEGQVRPRSSTGGKGLTISNSPGTIDSDYRGELVLLLTNHSDTPYEVNPGDRLAQMVVTRVDQLEVVEVDELDESERGEGGEGSTGR